MKVKTIPARDLTPALIARWQTILEETTEFASPYFHPHYVLAAASTGLPVEIGLILDGEEVKGFFPFERHVGDVARPVGSIMCDYQAVIAPSLCHWKARDILSGCKLKRWEFDHQLASQKQLDPYFSTRASSPIMNLSLGFEDYIERRKHADNMRTTLRKFRKLQREHNLKFIWHTDQDQIFDKMISWKSEQYRRTGAYDVFAMGWTVSLLKRIWLTQSSEFSGVLSVMHVDDQPVAIWFSMRSGKRLHSWFPTYNFDFASVSPGNCQLILIAQHAMDNGIDCIDLGKGNEKYKQMFASDSIDLAEGFVDSALSTSLLCALRRTRRWIKKTPFERPARTTLKWMRSF